MASPEQGETAKLSPFEKVVAATGLFLTVTAIAAPYPSTEAHQQTEPLIDRCKEKYPPQAAGLTMEDYFGVDRWGDEVYPKPPSERKNVLQILKERLTENQLHAYEVSTERTQRIEAQVNRFAAGMVERANEGDETYKFLQGGGGAFLDGSFVTGPSGGLEPAADDYEGFGWLWRDVKGDDGKIVKQEIVDGIYRYADGTYYPNPHPWTLSVADKNAQSTFEAPEGLGLARCASVPGNGATQGWRVSHYDFNHLGEPGFDTVQLEPWVYGNTTLADVQLADRRADHFIDNRYDPGIGQ
jgi:hypothetical protein